jgi:hypothetical protein
VSLQVLVNGFDVTNGVTHFLNYRETEGLFDPVGLVESGQVDTFDGPYRVRQTTVDYGIRKVKIIGRLNCRSLSYAEKLRSLSYLQSIYSPRPSRVVIGTLELQVDFNNVQVSSDEMKRLSTVINYTVEGTAIPATFACVYGAGTGLTQGIPIDTQRINETAVTGTFASGIVSFTCLGDAPTHAVVTIQGAASTTYYLATSVTGRRVPIVCDSLGVGRIDERAGFVLTPGTNRIVAYTASTGTTVATALSGAISLFGTVWRYTGNAAAGSATRMDLGPALTVNRTGLAKYFLGNTNPTVSGENGIITAQDDEPRIGWVWQNRRNLFIDSNDLSSSTATTRTGIGTNIYQIADPDGGLRGYRAISNASNSHITYSTSKVTSGAIVVGVQYTFSVYLRSTGASNTISAYIYDNTSSTSTSWAVTSTWTRFSITRTVANTGGWAIQIGGTDWTTGEGIELYGPQFELGASTTAYQATDASGISLDHPVNDSGLVLEGNATNVCLQSQDINTITWSKNGINTITTNNLAPDGTLTAFQGTSNAADSTITQTVAVTVGSTYTFSVWLRTTTGANTVNIYLSDGGVPISTSCSVTTNWARFSVTRTAVTATPVVLQIGGNTTWATGEVLEIWGAQLELGTAATSYIFTSNLSATRLADVAGLVSPHNLAIQSQDLSSATGAAWSSFSRWTSRTIVSAATSPSPNGTGGVTRLISDGTVTNPNIAFCRQTIRTSSSTIYTFSIWLKGTTTGSAFITIRNSFGGGLGSTTCNITTSWQRFFVTVINATANDSIIIDLNTQTANQTIDAFGAQLTEGHLPGRYIRTTDTQVLPVNMVDQSWSQNGYIEADIAWPNNTGVSAYSFGEGTLTTAGTIIFTVNASGAIIRFGRYDSGAGLRNAQIGNATVFNNGSACVRMEWTNYILAGSRYMMLRLYLNGSLQVENNYAATAGSTWPIVDVTRLVRLRPASGDQGTISNLILGTPSLPSGATPSGL